jgi:hypothetical protein
LPVKIELAKREQHEATSAYDTFKARYWGDPVGFCRDCVTWREGEGLAPYQEDAMRRLVTSQRLSLRGPHGLGKTAFIALIIWWFALTRDGKDWKIPTTASAWRQLTKFLWPEVHKWGRRLRWDVIGRAPVNERTELQTLNLKLTTGEAFAAASNRKELIEGAHADHLLYIFDESKAIPPDTFDAAEGAFSNAGDDTANEAYALAVSTPGEPQGRFYEIQSRKAGYEDWDVRAVTLEETIAAKRVSRSWAEQRLRQWGEKSAVYQNRVAGNFAANDEAGVIPLSWIEAANERWYSWVEAGKPGRLTDMGLDVGGGGDKTIRADRYRDRTWDAIDDLVLLPKAADPTDTMVPAGYLVAKARTHPGVRAVVDGIGIGAGTSHRAREQGVTVDIFIASEGSVQTDRSGEIGFVNRRAAAWWNLREMLDPSYGATLALPPDDRLTGDLTAPHYSMKSGGKYQIEGKDDIRERLGRSTDYGDPVVQACCVTEAPPRHTARQQNWMDE